MQTTRALLVGLAVCSVVVAQDVQVIVGFKDRIDAPLLRQQGAEPLHTLDAIDAVVVRVPAARVANLRRHAAIDFVELDHVVTLAPGRGGGGGGGGTQPKQTTPAGILRVGGPVAVAGVRVAIVDTGIDLDHPDLAANIAGNVNFVRPGYPGDDDHGHGSHCAGIVAGVDNSFGVVGVAPATRLLAAKCLDRQGSGSYSAIANAITWSADQGAGVISMSLGGSVGSSTLANACNYATARGSLLVAAAGNGGDCDLGTNEISYPAYYGNVVGVGATSTATMDALMCFSNTNPDVELSAPGHDVYSTYKGGAYATMSGTSMACPHVAGCAAVLLGRGVAAGSVLTTLVQFADDRGPAGRDNGFGFGVAEHTNID